MLSVLSFATYLFLRPCVLLKNVGCVRLEIFPLFHSCIQNFLNRFSLDLSTTTCETSYKLQIKTQVKILTKQTGKN